MSWKDLTTTTSVWHLWQNRSFDIRRHTCGKETIWWRWFMWSRGAKHHGYIKKQEHLSAVQMTTWLLRLGLTYFQCPHGLGYHYFVILGNSLDWMQTRSTKYMTKINLRKETAVKSNPRTIHRRLRCLHMARGTRTQSEHNSNTTQPQHKEV